MILNIIIFVNYVLCLSFYFWSSSLSISPSTNKHLWNKNKQVQKIKNSLEFSFRYILGRTWVLHPFWIGICQVKYKYKNTNTKIQIQKKNTNTNSVSNENEYNNTIFSLQRTLLLWRRRSQRSRKICRPLGVIFHFHFCLLFPLLLSMLLTIFSSSSIAWRPNTWTVNRPELIRITQIFQVKVFTFTLIVIYTFTFRLY